jgi:uncharacterized protein
MTTVTIIFRRRVCSGREPDYERWLGALQEASRSAPGYLGVETIRPGDGASVREYVSIVRFASYEHLRAWEDSRTRENWLERLPPGVVDGEAEIKRLDGLEFWFQGAGHPGALAPSPHKMVLLIIPIVIAIVSAMRPVLRAILGDVHPFIGLLISATVQVSLLTYVIMPRVTRLFSRWLFPK